MRYIHLSNETVHLLKDLKPGTYFFDRITKSNQLNVSEEMYRQIERITPLGQSMDKTIRGLIMGVKRDQR